MNPPQRSVERPLFLAWVRQSGLIPEAQLVQVLRQLPQDIETRPLARALVERGLLTRFQAERLLMGRTAGFFLGQYRILEQIGRGGVGRVYKAEHRTMRRIVAIKVLAPDLLETDRAIDLFLREVRACAQLVHPNIVTAFDANETDGRYYLVLEYVEGPNLDQLVRKQGPLSVGLACDYIRQAALGLQCAHLQKMVHRDIKPANILVQRQGMDGEGSPGLVKISDFGLARLAVAPPAAGFQSSPGTIYTRDNTVMGTPDYLSPEQARNLHKVDIRSDLYSLGCTFYFLLTGQVPYPGGNTLDKLIRHGTEQPQPIENFRSDVPAPVLAIVRKLMAKYPNDRFQTPAELAAALEPFAVSGATPWAPTRPQALPEDEEALVPSWMDSEDEISAMAQTVGGDGSPTPRVPGSSRVVARRPLREQRPLGKALLLAAGIAVALLGTAAVLALLFGR
jgi:serine/threonine-protein kinase